MNFFDVNPIIEQMLQAADYISDLNFSVGQPPQVEVSGQLKPFKVMGVGNLTPFQTEAIAMSLLRDNAEAASQLVKKGTADLSYALPGKTRFRVNIFQQRGSYSVVMRLIPSNIPTFDTLSLPPQLAEISGLRNGLVLLTGPTGSGKSSTLAAIIDRINEIKSYHIVTIEDPIEFLHSHKKSTINQREVGSDTKDFPSALRAALRQAPKVILIGEMRDLETTEIALEAAETSFRNGSCRAPTVAVELRRSKFFVQIRARAITSNTAKNKAKPCLTRCATASSTECKISTACCST
jgi:twitching motility protein PilT